MTKGPAIKLPGARVAVLAGMLAVGPVLAWEDTDLSGHLKSRISGQWFPENSAFTDPVGTTASDFDNILRINLTSAGGPWSVEGSAQFLALNGDSLAIGREIADEFPGAAFLAGRLPTDARRWWDLTHVSGGDDDSAWISRIDRLYLGYTRASLSLAFGRQALSWGNGLFYSPMDIINPFDPTQVDTEYKAGDDMIYGQWLQDNGNDLEAGYVFRRNPVSGDLDSEEATAALKYHGFHEQVEYDLMVSDHYSDITLGIGGSMDAGGAVWRGDLVLSDTDDGFEPQLVVNTSYSWTGWGRNMLGSLEYYFNGFGQGNGCYSKECLEDNPELLTRISRGQLFTLGRHYLGAGVSMEVSPLFTLTPNLFWNLSDGSALVQVVSNYSLGDNLVLLGALGVPVGPEGTEFGGLPIGTEGATLATDFSLFFQLGWYF